MKLHRNFATEERYLWWSVMSIILQVREEGNAMNGLLLSLAERQINAYYTALRIKHGITDQSDTENTSMMLTNGNGGASGSVDRTVVTKVLVRDKGKGKGKAKVEDEDTDDDVSSLEPSITSSQAEKVLTYDSSHVFHLVARFLELRVINSILPSTTPTPVSRLILPSVSYAAAGGSAREILLSHFSSVEGDRWCSAALGLEIQRREFELKYGTLAGGEWVKSWERMHRSIQDG